MVNTDKNYFNQEELKRALKDFKITKLDETDLKVRCCKTFEPRREKKDFRVSKQVKHKLGLTAT